jgi:hypothetical protein
MKRLVTMEGKRGVVSHIRVRHDEQRPALLMNL